jgi:hypothetical protein
MIPGLKNRGGCFADLDGDGDLDYVAAEVWGVTAKVRIFLRRHRDWRRGSGRTSDRGQQSLQDPWFVANIGNGRGAIVLPVSSPPYLYLLPLTSGGNFDGKPRPLGEFLPERLSQLQGVSSSPYRIESVEGATATSPARIRGRLADENARESQDLRFVVTLMPDGSVLSDAKQVAPGPEVGAMPAAYKVQEFASACAHESDERRSIIARDLADVDGDGIADAVLFSGVFSGHVFPGNYRGGKLTFGEERGRGCDVPIEDLRIWFPVRMVAGAGERPYATLARSKLAHLGLRFDVARRFDAAFTVRTERGKGWLLNYYATDAGLVPVQDYRSRWPHKDDCHPLSESHREAIVFDADHDRTPDILSVHVGQQFEWLRSPPRQRSRASMEHTREVDARRLRCGIVHGLGERLDEANRVLVQFEEDVQMPKSPGGQSPITVSRVPIYGPGGARARYCVLVRPLGLGLFFEVASVTPATARRRRYDAWSRRGERRLEMMPHYWACDEGVCEGVDHHHDAVFDDAVALFRRGAEFADTRREKAIVWRNVARAYGRAGRLKPARRAYERFVMMAKVVEPLTPAPPDLARLFADETFRALHGGWAKRWRTIKPGLF